MLIVKVHNVIQFTATFNSSLWCFDLIVSLYFSTKFGMYKPNCGLENVVMSWGHDEYMYQVLKHNKTTIPEEALYMIR